MGRNNYLLQGLLASAPPPQPRQSRIAISNLSITTMSDRYEPLSPSTAHYLSDGSSLASESSFSDDGDERGLPGTTPYKALGGSGSADDPVEFDEEAESGISPL